MDTGNFLQWDILVPTTQSLIEKGAMITIGETMGLAGEQSQQGGKGSRDGDIVPTVDTVRYAFLAGLLLTNKNSVLLTGATSWVVFVCACVPACVRARVRACVPVSKPTYVHVCVRACVHVCIHRWWSLFIGVSSMVVLTNG